MDRRNSRLRRKFAEAANAVVASHFRSGFDKLDALRDQYRQRPWFKSLGGQFTGEVVRCPDWLLRLLGARNEVGTPIDHDAVAVLRRVRVPMLWVLAEDDTFAPNATTRQRLREVPAKPLSVLMHPNTEHGILEFVSAGHGSRTMTRYADGYLRTTVDFRSLFPQ